MMKKCTVSVVYVLDKHIVFLCFGKKHVILTIISQRPII